MPNKKPHEVESQAWVPLLPHRVLNWAFLSDFSFLALQAIYYTTTPKEGCQD